MNVSYVNDLYQRVKISFHQAAKEQLNKHKRGKYLKTFGEIKIKDGKINKGSIYIIYAFKNRIMKNGIQNNWKNM